MEVEVVFPQVCGAFYKATIVELQTEEHRALLTFENGWKPDTWADLDHIRYLPPSPVDNFIEPGSTVEALLPHQDNEPPGWWNGTLLKSKGELHVVEFQSGNEKYQDIVDQDKIRAPNNNEPLSKYTFHHKEYPVPDDIQAFCLRVGIHENFRKRVEAVCVSYNQDKKALTVIADKEESLKRASLLIDIHLRDLKTQKQLTVRNEQAVQRQHQQQQRQLDSGIYEQQIYIPVDLVGLAIGREGQNVNEVRKLDGILTVEFEDYNQMFRVRAKTPEVLARAKELLEFTRDTVMIPKNLAGRVIGKRGQVIQQILEKSGVHNIRVMGDEEATDKTDPSADVPFDFVGRKAAVENAVLMLNYHLDHLKNVESILQSRRECDGPLEEVTFPSAPYRPYRGRGRMRERGGREEGGRWGGGGGWGGGERGGAGVDEGGWAEREYGERRGRRGGQWRGRGGGERNSREWRQPPEPNSPEPHPPSQSHEAQGEDELYHSSDESDTEEEEEEEEEDHRNGERNSEEEHSPPEADEQGPDRRRQLAPSRPQRGSWGGRGGGRGGGGGGGEGGGGGGGAGGGYVRGRGGFRGRGGRGRGLRGRGGGYRNSRPQQQRREGASSGTTNWDAEESKPDQDTTAGGGGGSTPKPQRTAGARGGRRRNDDTANTSQTQNTNTPDTAEPQ